MRKIHSLLSIRERNNEAYTSWMKVSSYCCSFGLPLSNNLFISIFFYSYACSNYPSIHHYPVDAKDNLAIQCEGPLSTESMQRLIQMLREPNCPVTSLGFDNNRLPTDEGTDESKPFLQLVEALKENRSIQRIYVYENSFSNNERANR